LKRWVGEELSFEEAAAVSFGRLLSELWHAEYLDQLPPLLNRFERLASAYFVRRGSVTAFHGFCNAWSEGVLRSILLFAEEELDLRDHSQVPAPYALLAAGGLGRLEQTLEESDRYFLVWTGDEAAYFEPFAYRVVALMDQLGLVGRDGTGSVVNALWRGSLRDWSAGTEGCGALAEGMPKPELLSDLRCVGGDRATGEEAIRLARSHLQRCRNDRGFPEVATRSLAVPVGLGLFGGICVERLGERAGSFSLTQSGLSPLVSAVRVLSLQYGLEAAPTLDRLAALGGLGVLENDLVERLQGAYHLLAGRKIAKEIALEPPYLDPSQLSATEQQKLKESLESVRQLQRVIRRAQLRSGESG
jgi:CBS domain-containing protein